VPSKITAAPMTPASAVRRIPGWALALVLVLALCLVAVEAALRIERVRTVSGHAGWSAAETGGDAASWRPQLIVPGNLNSSFKWLGQTRLMLSTGELRVRHIDYENAPFGHDVRSPSPYRWWLGCLAWACHVLTGQPLGPALETAALVSDPLLNLLLVASVTVFAARRLGFAAAAVVAAASAALFPLAVAFLPGAPDDQGLGLLAGLWSLLPLVAGMRAGARQRRWFLTAGIAAGLGLWVGVSSEVPVIAGIALGAVCAAWACRGEAAPLNPVEWRAWAVGGALTSLAAYILEYFPAHLGSWDLRAVHPIYGLAWLGLGELLVWATRAIQGVRPASKLRAPLTAVFAVIALASLPLAMRLNHSAAFLAPDITMLRLNRLPNGAASKDLMSWIIHEGWSPTVLATLLPLIMVGPALWLILRKGTGGGARASLAVLLGPLLVAVGFAGLRLTWWNGVDVVLLAMAGVLTAVLEEEGIHRIFRPAWFALAALVVAPGLFQSWPHSESRDSNALNELEVVGLIERDFGRWLALHSPSGGAIVLAPANATAALHYYGGVRGLGTQDLENQEGIQATVRIVSASTQDEALDMVGNRGVNFIVIPSWDNQLDAFARLGLGKLEGSFIHSLHRWVLPPWLRPVPYQLPVIQGFEGQSIVVLQFTEDQDDALLLSRIASYMVEMDNLGVAASAGEALRRFQADLDALVGRAEVLVANGQTDEFAHTVETIIARLGTPGERSLPLDRRVSLAVVLAQAHHLDLARMELGKCISGISDENLRSLSMGSLYHLQVLTRALKMEIADPKLRQLALDLLPPDIESKLVR